MSIKTTTVSEYVERNRSWFQSRKFDAEWRLALRRILEINEINEKLKKEPVVLEKITVGDGKVEFTVDPGEPKWKEDEI
jgi:hypothetical protein